jgi:DNA-binding transcriptional regulator YiaG
MTDNFYLTGESVSDAKPYSYRSCGLDGIFLLNGYEIREHDGEEHAIIKDIDGLHLAIGRHLVLFRKGLAPKEIKFLRKTMDLSQAELAEKLGNNSQSVARWEKGECEIPGPTEKLLRAYFLASNMVDDSDLETLKTLIVEGLSELDAADEHARPAQFQLTNHWVEKKAA